MIIPALASALRRTARITIERPRAGLWSQLALACALFAVAVAGVAAFSVERWIAARPATTASMVVYLADGTTDARARELTDELRRLQGIVSVELVPPAESAKRLVAEGKLTAADVPETDGYAPPAGFMDGVVYDGRKPNLYLQALKIGLK